jgi:hypothetical protein
MGALHAYALATRLAQVSDHPLSLNQATLYPALVRLEQKGWIKGSSTGSSSLDASEDATWTTRLSGDLPAGGRPGRSRSPGAACSATTCIVG